LNPSTIVVVITTDDAEFELDENMFGMGALIEESS
jgi:hypothetical protein